MSANYRLMENAISIQGLYDAYGEYGHGLIDVFQSALDSMGCTCTRKSYYQKSYAHSDDVVAIWFTWPEGQECEYEGERLDVSKEFIKRHQKELTRLILRGLISQTMLEAEMKYEMDEEAYFPALSVIEEGCAKVVENLFRQLD